MTYTIIDTKSRGTAATLVAALDAAIDAANDGAAYGVDLWDDSSDSLIVRCEAGEDEAEELLWELQPGGEDLIRAFRERTEEDSDARALCDKALAEEPHSDTVFACLRLIADTEARATAETTETAPIGA